MMSKSLKNSGKPKRINIWKATEPENIIHLILVSKVFLLALAICIAKSKDLAYTPDKFYEAKGSRFTKTFDKTLLSPNTCLLYIGKEKMHTNILCQLRSGISRLNKYLVRINVVESDECKCSRGEESVDHFLFRCPRWNNCRGTIRRLADDNWKIHLICLERWSEKQKDWDAAKGTQLTRC